MNYAQPSQPNSLARSIVELQDQIKQKVTLTGNNTDEILAELQRLGERARDRHKKAQNHRNHQHQQA